ncbi:ARM repeat-containing protein [Tilletiaria anomala UBC 951]|uniref:ARM repeat-containing protein n=1 Tax=Tilletiaria anomala (strain ATCC 24038 / CBS 436.72 / UBC 951) TaxID=1037660 RepID=A0A066WJX9_TILAU|nr:ARM repeat-containing protein [Tilletiaria anomala UBC 951]KDN52838.1 ARM repeat-containing protein [Tilletiaria anomala UBC 951]
MFERSLESLIKGFRSHRGKDEPRYLAIVLAEIRHEVRSGDMEIKAEAILKLIYLQMLGHVSSQAAFHVVEVMASSRYHFKYIGYLGAAQLLEPGTDVLILATNLVKKDLTSRSDLDTISALSGFSYLMTPDLAQHFTSEITSMLNHSKPVIRKKAVIALHSIITHDPSSLDKAWTRLQDRLEDSDPGVVSATVSILCELARKDPRPFLPLSPQLFQLLTTSTNNWVLIKVVKLFGALSTCEPRLSRRLLPPITSIIASTPAMSLLYECIHTIIVGDMLATNDGYQLAQTCVEKLANFLDDSDQNLRFIALVALIKILPTHPHLVEVHRSAITQLLNAEDSTVRLRAITLLTGLSNRNNFEEYCATLESALRSINSTSSTGTTQEGGSAAAAKLRAVLATAASAKEVNPPDAAVQTYAAVANRNFIKEVSTCIAAVGAKDNYARVQNFEAYIGTLLRLYPDAGAPFRRMAERQLVDILRRESVAQPLPVKAKLGVERGKALIEFCMLRAKMSMQRVADV